MPTERRRAQSRASYRKRRDEEPLLAVKDALRAARRRAEAKTLPFSLTLADVLPLPATCPALGIPLTREGGRNSPNLPELDRIIPTLGYVPGNVAWLSRRANTIKNNASPFEIYAVAKWAEDAACRLSWMKAPSSGTSPALSVDRETTHPATLPAVSTATPAKR